MAIKSLAAKIKAAEQTENFFVGKFKGRNLNKINTNISYTLEDLSDRQESLNAVIDKYNESLSKCVQSLKGLQAELTQKRNNWLAQKTVFADVELTNQEWITRKHLETHPDIIAHPNYQKFIKELTTVHDKVLTSDYWLKRKNKIEQVKLLENGVYANKEALTGLYNVGQTIVNISKSLNELQAYDDFAYKNGYYDDAMKNISTNETVLIDLNESLENALKQDK